MAKIRARTRGRGKEGGSGGGGREHKGALDSQFCTSDRPWQFQSSPHRDSSLVSVAVPHSPLTTK